MFATGQPCIHEPAGQEAAGLVAAVLAGAASRLLETFGTALTEGAKGGALPSSVATTNLQLRPGAAPRCVVFVRGAFTTAGSAGPIDMETALGLRSDDAEGRRRLQALDLPEIYRLDQFIELRLVNANNNAALTFAPVYVRMGRSIDGQTRGTRDLSIMLQFNKAGGSPAGGVVLVSDRRLGEVGQVFVANAERRYIYEAPWFTSFNPPVARGDQTSTTVAVSTASASSTSPTEPRTATAGTIDLNPEVSTPAGSTAEMQYSGADGVPITATVTVVETRPTNEGLAFIAEVFGAARPKIQEALTREIDDDAAATAETAALSLDMEYATAEGAARIAMVAYCRTAAAADDAVGTQDRLTKSAAARSAQIKANIAAIKAGVARPFSSLVVVSGAAPSVANTGACEGV